MNFGLMMQSATAVVVPHLYLPIASPRQPFTITAVHRRELPFKSHRPLSLKSHQLGTSNPETATNSIHFEEEEDDDQPFSLQSGSQPTTTYEVDEGIPIEHVKTLVKFKSRYNYIRVLQVSRAADHPLAGSRLLLLDVPGNIHSISFLLKTFTDTYFDVFATLPPVIPPGPIAILGFGAGSAAKIILETYPDSVIHGWELDPSVISVAREYFGLEKLEKKYPDRLVVNTGNALSAGVKDGFAGILVDLYSKGCVISELQDVETWEKLKRSLRKGGRIMVNVGGSCVEPEDMRKDGSVIMVETLEAMYEVFGKELFVLRLYHAKDDSTVAVTGALPGSAEWKKCLKKPLKSYVDMWERYDG